jgi:hypothetical protein
MMPEITLAKYSKRLLLLIVLLLVHYLIVFIPISEILFSLSQNGLMIFRLGGVIVAAGLISFCLGYTRLTVKLKTVVEVLTASLFSPIVNISRFRAPFRQRSPERSRKGLRAGKIEKVSTAVFYTQK